LFASRADRLGRHDQLPSRPEWVAADRGTGAAATAFAIIPVASMTAAVRNVHVWARSADGVDVTAQVTD
jgi:hypothetical protein